MSPRIILGQKFYTSVCTAVVENKLGHIVAKKTDSHFPTIYLLQLFNVFAKLFYVFVVF